MAGWDFVIPWSSADEAPTLLVFTRNNFSFSTYSPFNEVTIAQCMQWDKMNLMVKPTFLNNITSDFNAGQSKKEPLTDCWWPPCSTVGCSCFGNDDVVDDHILLSPSSNYGQETTLMTLFNLLCLRRHASLKRCSSCEFHPGDANATAMALYGLLLTFLLKLPAFCWLYSWEMLPTFLDF